MIWDFCRYPARVTNQPSWALRFLSLSFPPLKQAGRHLRNQIDEENQFVLYPDFHLWSQQASGMRTQPTQPTMNRALKLALMSSINVAVLRPLKVGWPGSHAEMYMESPLESQPVASGQWMPVTGWDFFCGWFHLRSAKLGQAMEKSHHVDDIYQEKVGIYTKKNWPYLKPESPFLRLTIILGNFGYPVVSFFPVFFIPWDPWDTLWTWLPKMLENYHQDSDSSRSHLCGEPSPHSTIHSHNSYTFWRFFFRPP